MWGPGIYTDDSSQRMTVGLPSPNICQSDSYDFQNSPFVFSESYNLLMVEGCGGSVVLKNRNGNIMAGCTPLCNNNTSICRRGVGCCQASLLSSPSKFDYYEISLDSEQLPASNSSSCNITAVLIESASVMNFTGKLSGLPTLPTVLKWQAINTLPDLTDHRSFTCQIGDGIQCQCQPPFEGNPFLPNGCRALNSLVRRAFPIVFSSGMGLVLLVLGGYCLYRFLKRRKDIKRKADYFKMNGGLLLQQQMSSNEGIVQRTKVYTVTELQKATDNFNENLILGQGGQGTVYKGMLMDGRIVAIKKSKRVDETQVESFINEVVILSQINHRNVVGLLGCCLETEVPILVYEFVPNGTLYEHIQGAGDAFHITWKMRLQIAAESAGAIAYLHSSSAAPIFHRDIKSTNILLDEKYRAKVSDFGTSRAITIEQTHVTTAVQGTYGYLDPEYFQSNQFNEKSDVYSFGVVLVELLTGKKPISPVGNGSWLSLAVEFLSKMEGSRLSDILDSRILDEGKEYEFKTVTKLARKCLNMNGKLRPTMKEVAVQLDAIRSLQIPISKEAAKAKESNHAVIEVINLNHGPLSRSTASLDDDPPARSIEIQPLMGT